MTNSRLLFAAALLAALTSPLAANAAGQNISASPGASSSHSISISQHNAVNASVTAVVGNNTTVTTTQTGIVNGSVVGEIGSNNSAITSQLGRINNSAIAQGSR